MRPLPILPLFAIPALLASLLLSCTIEHAEEQVVEAYDDGAKKTSLWVYPDGEILKRNEWYSNGIKKLEVAYKDNRPHGDVKEWTYLGDVVLEGTYRDGKREGTWKTFYDNKKKQSTRYYRDDHEVGDWVGVYPDGATSFEEHYSDNGDSIGVWKKFHENGKIAEENSCFGTNPKGFLKEYRNDGTLEFEKDCKNGIYAGRQVHYYSDGKKVQWKENFHNNPYGQLDTNTIFRTFYYGNGMVQKEEQWDYYIKDGVWEYGRKGVWKWYDPEGALLKESLVHYDTLGMGNIIEDRRTDYGFCGNTTSDSLVHFTVCAETTFTVYAGWKLHDTLWYYIQGHLLRYEEYWDRGTLKGNRSYYIDSLDGNPQGGILASEGYALQGKRDGIWRNWYKNGVLKDSLTYVDGERVGEQFGYDSTGKLTIHKTENGKNKPVIVHILGQVF